MMPKTRHSKWLNSIPDKEKLADAQDLHLVVLRAQLSSGTLNGGKLKFFTMSSGRIPVSLLQIECLSTLKVTGNDSLIIHLEVEHDVCMILKGNCSFLEHIASVVNKLPDMERRLGLACQKRHTSNNTI
jgi:hypothetical protein